jgi:hypothetical protein
LISEKEEEAAREMFMTDGWKNLMEEIEDQLDLCTIDACNTIEDLHFSKGRQAVLRMILNYESYVKQEIQEDDVDLIYQ